VQFTIGFRNPTSVELNAEEFLKLERDGQAGGRDDRDYDDCGFRVPHTPGLRLRV